MIPIKNEREIGKMREACRTASMVLDRVSALIRPGITSDEIYGSAKPRAGKRKTQSHIVVVMERQP